MFPVAQRDVVWFYVTPAQRNVYLSVAARACLLNASSSSRAQTKRYTVNPPPPKSNFDDGRSTALCTTPSASRRYANFSVRVATCATDTGHLGLQQLDVRVTPRPSVRILVEE